MTMTITLKPEVEEIVKSRAVAMGFDVEDYIEKLIKDDSKKLRSIDEIFAPFRKEIEESGITDDEVDELFLQARKEVYAEKKARLKS